MGKRPRIKKNNTLDENYGESYQTNAASKNAKFLFKYEAPFDLELWIDKHYTDRKNFGDESGPREDIEEKYVEILIKKSLPHLFYYSLKHKDFTFVNFPPPKARRNRIVLKEIDLKKGDLNLIVEYQFLALHQFEVTVITAMRKFEFEISDNQYCIQFEDDVSYLIVNKNKKNCEIDSY